MTSIYEQLTKSLEYSRKSNYEKLDILDQQIKENKINEGTYLRECNKLKSKKQSAQLQVELIDEDSSDDEESSPYEVRGMRISYLENYGSTEEELNELEELQRLQDSSDEE